MAPCYFLCEFWIFLQVYAILNLFPCKWFDQNSLNNHFELIILSKSTLLDTYMQHMWPIMIAFVLIVTIL